MTSGNTNHVLEKLEIDSLDDIAPLIPNVVIYLCEFFKVFKDTNTIHLLGLGMQSLFRYVSLRQACTTSTAFCGAVGTTSSISDILSCSAESAIRIHLWKRLYLEGSIESVHNAIWDIISDWGG